MALSHLVVQYESNFCTVALQFIEEEKNYTVPSPANTAGSLDTFTHTQREDFRIRIVFSFTYLTIHVCHLLSSASYRESNNTQYK